MVSKRQMEVETTAEELCTHSLTRAIISHLCRIYDRSRGADSDRGQKVAELLTNLGNAVTSTGLCRLFPGAQPLLGLSVYGRFARETTARWN